MSLRGLYANVLIGEARLKAIATICANHYTKSVPSGKSHYVQFGDAIVVWSIPANKNIGKYVLGIKGNVWELSRLWAPDAHEKNLLTMAISAAVKEIANLENPDLLVSYADPNVGHKGGVYRAASWIYHGQSKENRAYSDDLGNVLSRRAFHSGKRGLTKCEIEAKGYMQLKIAGKERFIKPLSSWARRAVKKRETE